MDPLPLTPPELGLGIVFLTGVGLFAWALARLFRRRRSQLHGRLVRVDHLDRRDAPLRSARWRIVGRPDELRRLADGRSVPVEIKSRGTPPRGPPASHRIQVEAYLALVEETTGLPPPYGVLRYSDGGEFRIPWDPAARNELAGVRAELDRPYDGRATPSPARCRRCRWRNGCDVRAI